MDIVVDDLSTSLSTFDIDGDDIIVIDDIDSIGQYNDFESIGSGRFSTVYSAINTKTDESVAVKVIDKKTKMYDEDLIKDEIEACRILKSHKNIVSMLSHFETPTRVCLVFELINGISLFDMMDKLNFAPISEKKSKHIMLQLSSAIQYCHRKKIAHRDIKLDNIMVNLEFNIKLIDFGLCCMVTDKNGLCEDHVGSMEYAAPEIFTPEPYNPYKADIYSMGVVMYALLIGCFPFSEKNILMIRSGVKLRPVIPSDANVSISDDAWNLIYDMMNPYPEYRININKAKLYKWMD